MESPLKFSRRLGTLVRTLHFQGSKTQFILTQENIITSFKINRHKDKVTDRNSSPCPRTLFLSPFFISQVSLQLCIGPFLSCNPQGHEQFWSNILTPGNPRRMKEQFLHLQLVRIPGKSSECPTRITVQAQGARSLDWQLSKVKWVSWRKEQFFK